MCGGHHRERNRKLDIQELQALFLCCQSHDLLLESLVLFLQRMKGLEHFYNVYAGLPVALFLQELLNVWGCLRDILQRPTTGRHGLIEEGGEAADGRHGRKTLLR